MRWMIALGLTALVGCSMEPAQQILGTLETDRIQLSLDSQEPVLSIEVVEGQQVTAGQLLLTQDPARLDASLASAATPAATGARTFFFLSGC
jgi:multidrug efflux pump subunit AcrA (membrane-fusion protein)